MNCRFLVSRRFTSQFMLSRVGVQELVRNVMVDFSRHAVGAINIRRGVRCVFSRPQEMKFVRDVKFTEIVRDKLLAMVNFCDPHLSYLHVLRREKSLLLTMHLIKKLI